MYCKKIALLSSIQTHLKLRVAWIEGHSKEEKKMVQHELNGLVRTLADDFLPATQSF
jgi:hypothetical protein